jgi:ubiquinone/menaquinone biosynthesis C-methylase UbiE
MTDKSSILEREKEFHDRWAASISHEIIDVAAYFEASTAPENRYILDKLGDLSGKKILDLGCGAGESGVYFATKGAQCVLADYSPGMVQTALLLAEKYHVVVQGKQIDAMGIDYPDESFDIVYSANLLHHVQPEKTLREVHRILKPGGKACFWDPLKHNPIINVYRRMATDVRSTDEAPLDISLVNFIRSIFSEVEYDTFWLATLWIFLRFYFIERIHPNDERYWKKIITDEPRLRKRYLRLEKIDNLVKKIPFMKRYAWNIAVVATK